MNEEKIKIIEATYNPEKTLAKVKVLKIASNKEVTWALIGDDFDSLIAQATGISFSFSDEQRLTICDKLKGLEFMNIVKIDVENADIDKAKDKNSLELQHGHDAVDRYPFYEIQQEAMEEAINGTPEDKDES